MKAGPFHSLALLLTLFWLGARAAEPTPPPPNSTPSTTELSVATTAAAQTNQPAIPAEPGTNAPPARSIEPAQIALPDSLTELVRLAESGVPEDVLLAFVQQSPPREPLTADQILYLRDLGISSAVLTALIKSHPANASAPPEPAPPTPVPTPDVAAPTVPQYPPADQTTNVVEAPLTPPEVDESYFYSSLSPYGAWLDLPGYGWCWQPTVAVVSSTWRPYCDGGYWAWSDCGWYWNSYYSWGWAPFHYGRWCQYPRYGWVWCPDRVWGPAWVCWRQTGTHCGWAPLPPGACITRAGWTYRGIAVGASFGFGLPHSSFTFVAADHFTDRHGSRHHLREREAQVAFNESKVNNDVIIGGRNQRVINRGIDPNRIAAATRQPIRPVAVSDLESTRRSPKPPSVAGQHTGPSSSFSARTPGVARTPAITSPKAAPAIQTAPAQAQRQGTWSGPASRSTQGSAGVARSPAPQTSWPQNSALPPSAPAWRQPQQPVQNNGSGRQPNGAFGAAPSRPQTIYRSQPGSSRSSAGYNAPRSQAPSSPSRSSSSSASSTSSSSSRSDSSSSRSSSGNNSTGGSQRR